MKTSSVLERLNEGEDGARAMTPFPLAHAVLCVDCDAIHCLPALTCPLCASPVFVPLARWLGANASGAAALIKDQVLGGAVS